MKFKEAKIGMVRGGMFLEEEYFKIREKELGNKFLSNITTPPSLKSLVVDKENTDSQTLSLRSKKRKPPLKFEIADNRIFFSAGRVDRNERGIITKSIPMFYNIAMEAFQISQWKTVGIQFQFAIPLKSKNASQLLSSLPFVNHFKNTKALGSIDEFKSININFAYIQKNIGITLHLGSTKDDMSILLFYDQRIAKDKLHSGIEGFYQDAWNNMEEKLNKFTEDIFKTDIIDTIFLKTGEPAKIKHAKGKNK